MSEKTRIQIVKRIIKIAIATCVLGALIVLGFFVKSNHTFENSDLTKWLKLSESQQISTLQHLVPNDENQELLIQCVTKIAQLPDSDKMDIRDAVALCYGGIKVNIDNDKQ